MRPLMLKLLILLGSTTLAPACSGGENNDANDAGMGNDDGDNVVTNGCGTYDLTGPTDSYVPDDPESPGIVEACEAWCGELAGLDTCPSELEPCVEECKQGACDVCPGTWEPLVRCRVEYFDADACYCATGGGSDCNRPDECLDAFSATGQCGG